VPELVLKFSTLLAVRFLPGRRFALLLVGLAGACACSWSQTVSANVDLLGMRHEQVQTRLAGIQSVRSPRRLSSGALGSLRVPDLICEGIHFEQTLFFSHQKLAQMELVPISPGAGAYGDLVQSLRVQLGPELASSSSTPDTVMETASWVTGDADVMLFRSGRPGNPGLRLVIRQRLLPDASEL
jgi:hypothetical protein